MNKNRNCKNRTCSYFWMVIVTCCLLASRSIAQSNKSPGSNSTLLPGTTIADGWGVQLKRHSNTPADLDQIKALGLTYVRHGFIWESIEKEKDIYDFSYYDRLVKDCKARGLKIVGCIAFNNIKIYGVHAKDEPARSAYARFAAALVNHYKGYNIIWEIWNEPNVMTFWGRHGGVGNSEQYATEYLGLVKATVAAMRATDPNCVILGGSVSNMWTESYKWMNFAFQKGLLKTGISALSVHPYGVKSPEDYIKAYDTTRKMMLNAGGPMLPLINSERGFPLGKMEGFAGGDSSQQYQYQAWHIVRQYLVDKYLSVNGTIWYEWIGAGNEKDFSLYQPGSPLPIFTACKVLIEQLNGYHLDKRLATGSNRDFILKFTHPSGAVKLVAWTAPPPMTSPDKIVPHLVSIPIEKSGEIETVDLYGNKGKLLSKGRSIAVQLSGAPQYISMK
jgi:hypothetical protein